MIYIVGITDRSDGRIYNLFESNTDSFFRADRDDLQGYIDNRRMHIQEIDLYSNGQRANNFWLNPLHYTDNYEETGSDYMLICKMPDNTYKLASYDNKVIYLDIEQLRSFSSNNKIVNCSLVNGKIKSIKANKITNDIQFEKAIAEKYKIYEAKSTLLGCKMSFDYAIEGKQVKLIKYTGTTKNMIVPKFVTTIMTKAFLKCEIETITLEKGLRYIGNYAFDECKLSEVIIPQTVVFIGWRVFNQNKHLLTNRGAYREDRIKILGKNTTIIDPLEGDKEE